MRAEQCFHKGKYKLETIPHEMKMSHWVYAPVLIDTESHTKIIDLVGDLWSLMSAKESDDSITLMLTRYPDASKEYELKIYPKKDDATIDGEPTKICNIGETLDAIK